MSSERIPFGKLLYQRRKALGLRQKDVADALRVSQNTVSRWEMAYQAPTNAHLLETLASLLGVDPDDLRDGVLRSEKHEATLQEQIETLARAYAVSAGHMDLLRRVFTIVPHLPLEDARRVDDYIDLLANRKPKEGAE
jgi:transcriptional regulator with XRE-family HTH domain